MSFKSVMKDVLLYTRSLVIVLSLSLLITIFIFQPYIVNGGSMEPTFQGADEYDADRIGDRVFIFKAPFYLGSIPEYGDAVIINSHIEQERTLQEDFMDSPLIQLVTQTKAEKSKYWIKRVIGKPGDTISFLDGEVCRNGEPLSEPYIKEAMMFPFESVTVPEDHVFVMGDNRNNSYDSRQIGTVPVDHVIGKVVLRFFPFNKMTMY